MLWKNGPLGSKALCMVLKVCDTPLGLAKYIRFSSSRGCSPLRTAIVIKIATVVRTVAMIHRLFGRLGAEILEKSRDKR